MKVLMAELHMSNQDLKWIWLEGEAKLVLS